MAKLTRIDAPLAASRIAVPRITLPPASAEMRTSPTTLFIVLAAPVGWNPASRWWFRALQNSRVEADIGSRRASASRATSGSEAHRTHAWPPISHDPHELIVGRSVPPPE